LLLSVSAHALGAGRLLIGEEELFEIEPTISAGVFIEGYWGLLFRGGGKVGESCPGEVCSKHLGVESRVVCSKN
jgi:hypothetical protein